MTENLLTKNQPFILQIQREWKNLKTERTIHTGIFFLLLAGLWGVSAWVLSTNIPDALLKFGSIALSWGVILLVLYVTFKWLDWTWWT